MLNKVAVQVLRNDLAQLYDCFICCASFEERGVVVAAALDPDSLQSAVVFNNLPASKKSIDINNRLLGMFSNKAISIDIKIGQPLYTLDQFHLLAIPAIRRSSKKTLIDKRLKESSSEISIGAYLCSQIFGMRKNFPVSAYNNFHT